jgi:hypothetical protein
MGDVLTNGFEELLDVSDQLGVHPADLACALFDEEEELVMSQKTERDDGLSWPLGQSGDRVYVAVKEDADSLAEVFAGEPQPEDFNAGRSLVLGIPGLDIAPARVYEELTKAPGEVRIVLTRSEESQDFVLGLLDVMLEAGVDFPGIVFLPPPLTLRDLIAALPGGREAPAPGSPSRVARLIRVLILAEIASMSDDSLASCLRREAGLWADDLVDPDSPPTYD